MSSASFLPTITRSDQVRLNRPPDYKIIIGAGPCGREVALAMLQTIADDQGEHEPFRMNAISILQRERGM